MAMVAHIFADLRMTPFFCQSAIGGPNRGWFISHEWNLGELLAKQNEARSKNGVVGNTGVTTPTRPIPVNTSPTDKKTSRVLPRTALGKIVCKLFESRFDLTKSLNKVFTADNNIYIWEFPGKPEPKSIRPKWMAQSPPSSYRAVDFSISTSRIWASRLEWLWYWLRFSGRSNLQLNQIFKPK